MFPIALEAVKRLDALFDIERAINGCSPAERLAARREHSAPLMDDLHSWLQDHLAKLSRSHDLAKACQYMLRRWPAFTRFLDDGRICLTNNAAERVLRCIPLGGVVLLRLRPRRAACCCHLHVDPHREAQRRGSASLARQYSCPHC